MSKSRKMAYLALLTTSVVWGFAPPIIKYTPGFISPTDFLFYRFLLVSLILLVPLILRLNHRRITKNQLLNYLFLGFLATPLNLFILFKGIEKTTSINATVISITSPILIIIGGAFFLHEKITRMEKIGIGLTIAGTIFTIVQPLLETGVNFSQNTYGNLLVFLGAMEWAIFTLLSKKHKELDPFILTAFSFLLGLIIFLPLFVIRHPSLTGALPPSPAFFGILYMALFGSVIAYFTYIWGLSKIEASEATVFTYLQPLFAVPLAAIWLKEPLTLPFLIGAILIGVGVFVCESRPKKLSTPTT